MKFTFRFLILATLMLVMLLSLYLLRYTKYTKYIPNLPTLSVFSTDGQPSSHSASAINPEDSFDIQLWEQIARANANHAARNEHIFGPLTDQNLVIVVQVHNRVNYLRALINSMVKVRHIEETLVVFSHDFFDDQINKLVTGVNFTKVINIPIVNYVSLTTCHQMLPGGSNILSLFYANLEANLSGGIAKRLSTRC